MKRSLLILIAFSLSLKLAGQVNTKEKFYLIDTIDVTVMNTGDKVFLDSTLHVYWKTHSLKERLNAISNIIERIVVYSDIWPRYNDLMHDLSKGKKDRTIRKIYALSISNKGYIEEILNQNHKAAKEFYLQALKIQQTIRDTAGEASTNTNLGVAYANEGNMTEAINCFNRSIKLNLAAGDTSSLAIATNNLGYIFQETGDTAKALEMYKISLKYNEQLKYKREIVTSLLNIGVIYQQQKKYEDALNCFNRCLILSKEVNDLAGVCLTKINIGFIYSAQKKYALSKKELSEALALNKEIQLKDLETMALVNLASVYMDEGRTNKALEIGKEALKISKEINFTIKIVTAAELLTKVYRIKGDYKNALQMYELAERYKDSLQNDDIRKSSLRSQFKYEYEKKSATDRIKNEAETKVIKAELKRESFQRYALYIGLSIVLIFSVFIFNRFRVTQKQKVIIEEKSKETEEQKSIIEEKQKEIIDSINYAKRIQEAVITSETYLKNHLDEFFVLFLPKDIVAGDFYWAADTSNGFYLATADCTGHGVPGAFMSMLGINFLHEIILEKKIQDPGEILNELRRNIIRTMNPHGGNEEGKDGMDIALYHINKEKNMLSFACANNPIWIINRSDFTELKGHKMPVGKYSGKENEPFISKTVPLKKGDIIYTLTDGYPDQFGGEKGKKFKYSNLEKLLMEIQSSAMEEQKDSLRNRFLDWRKDHEQTDDVCIIGVKI